MKITKTILLLACIALFVMLFYLNIKATPQLALWTGNRCSTCHISNQGGSMRADFGWKFAKESSIFSIYDNPLRTIYSIDKNQYSYFDNLFAYGLDFRYQSTRSGKTQDAKRKYYPMQASFYANSQSWDWLLLEGQYNYGNLIYNGQQEWSASAYFKPSKNLPSLHIGKFEPAMGLYECDMTMLDRRFAIPDGTEQFIPPDYSELGAELIYESLDWLSVNAGVYDSWNLNKLTVWGSDLQYLTVPHNPSFSFRTVFYPEWYFDNFPSSFIGAAVLVNGHFKYYDVFAGYSILDNVSLEARYFGSNLSGTVEGIPTKQHTNSFIGQINYIPYKGIILTARAETGNNKLIENDNSTQYDFSTQQYVFSLTLQPIPYLELITQYRIINSLYYTSGRWLFQLHLYY